MSLNTSAESDSSVCPACATPLVAQLGGHCPRCLLGLAEEFQGPAGTVTTEGRPEEFPVQGFGDYELLAEIARGGMGVVYRARQLSLNREVALKRILAGELAGPESRRMFQREAHAAASLHHPNIVPVYEIGEHDLQPYFTMRLVPGGRTIADWAATRRGQWRELAAAGAQAAHAVAFAHSHGILHRDLKPSNILWDDQAGPQVTDFGLAKLLDEADGGATLSARILGSPNYMAPEQAGGRTAEITTATDVFGLGAVLYELLSGHPPFRGTSALDTMRRAAEEAPAPLPEVPADLCTICLKCLEKDPARRYRSAAALGDDLERWLRQEPILARPASAAERFAKWVRRRPVHAALAGTVGLAIAVVVVGLFWHNQRITLAGRATEAANRELATQLRRVEWQQAEDALAEGRTSDGLATFARFLRETPGDTVVAARLLSLLEMRDFPLALLPPLKHGKPVNLVRLDAAGRRLFTICNDGILRAWNLTNGALDRVAEVHLDNRVLKILPESQRLLLGNQAGHFLVWDPQRWQPVLELGEAQADFTRWGLSEDGQLLCFATRQRELQLRDTSSGRLLARTNPPQPDLEISGTIGPAGETLLRGAQRGLWIWRPLNQSLTPLMAPDQATKSAHCDWPRQRAFVCVGDPTANTNLVIRLDLVTGHETLRKPTPREWHTFQPSEDGKLLLLSRWSTGATVMDADTLNLRLPWFGRAPIKANLSPDRLFQVGFRALHDGSGRLYDLGNGQVLMEPIQQEGLIISHQVSPDGHRLVTGSQDGNAWLWDVRMRSATTALMDVGAPVNDLALSPDGHRLAFATDRTLQFCEPGTGRRLTPPLPQPASVNGLSFSPDGRFLSAASSDGSVSLLDAQSGRTHWHQKPHRTRAWRAVFSPDGSTLASEGEDGAVHVFDTVSGHERFPRLMQNGAVTDTRFSPDGSRIATCSVDATARLWDAHTGQAIGKPLKHHGTVWTVRFSPDGHQVLTASADRTAQIWEVRTGAPVGLPIRADQGLTGALFSNDGQRVLISTLNGARIFEARTAKALTPLMRHGDRVKVAAFSPHERWVATASEDGTTRIWDARSGFPITDPLRYAGLVTGLVWFPDSRGILTSCADGKIRTWQPPEITAAPAWLPDLAETLAGKRNDREGGSTPVSMDQLETLRQQAINHRRDQPQERWLHWFLVRRLESPDSRPFEELRH